MRPRLSVVNQAEAFWEVGREPGRQVVSLGVAVTLTAVSIDVLLVGRLTLFFDLCFMVLCLGLAALVRRRDFYLVALLPPVLLTAVFAFVALVARDPPSPTRPTACSRPWCPASPRTASPSSSATPSAWAGWPGACTARARPTSPPSSAAS